MKLRYILLLLILAQSAFAQEACDIKLGTSVGVRVVEYVTGNVIHSKIALREVSVASLKEEMTNLQDMGICEPRITSQRCILKPEKRPTGNQLTLIRGSDRWLSWSLAGKTSAQKFVKILHHAGFCNVKKVETSPRSGKSPLKS